MNFVQTLEESLRDLAAEARKKHPGVKEASERATLRLRVLKNAYVSAVRQANSGTAGSHHPTTSMFQSSDLLHPFLLAANYPNASPRLLELSFRAMKLLMEGDAIVPTDSIQLIRVWMIQANVVSAYYTKQYSKEKDSSSSVTTSGSSTTKSSSTTVSSGWFSWGGSASSASSSNVHDDGASSSIATPAATAELPSKSIVKSAVSSSSGQTGQASPSQAQMEKLALEILSCLLQLLELMRNYPAALTPEVWSNAVALSCIWLGTVPTKHKIHQAAHSTITQIISLLYHPDSMQNAKFLTVTWDDLLTLSCSRESSKKGSLSGAFSLCKKTATDHGLPSSELALELMCQVWKEGTFSPIEKTMVTTMSMTLQLLEQLPKSSVEKSLRVAQWSLALLKAQARTYPNECRELFMMLVKAIPRATEACRNHHDFEDGYVYTREEARARTFSIESAQTSSKESHRRSSTSNPSYASFFPISLLWKAGFALEVAHHVLDQGVDDLSFLYDDRVAMANIAEALSDFATIGASCRDHTLQLVDFCEQQVVKGMKPSMFRNAESAILSKNGTATFADEAVSSDKKATHSGVKDLLGEALWVAFQGVLRVAEILSELANPEALLAGTFAPLLAVLQHYMKRVIACEHLVSMSLEGFSTVAAACIPFEGCTLQRKALLTSLCKLSLPTWGKHDSSSQLLDHHVRSLFCVLRIVHRFHNNIASEWDVILWTFEELSVMAIASPLLSDEAYHSALAIAAAYCRLPEFSTCLSDESLLQLAEAAADICKTIMQNRDVVGDSDIVLLDRASLADAAERGDGKESSISEKIVNIGVRAIYGNQSEEHDGKPLDLQEDRVRKVFFQDYRISFLRRLATSKNTVRGTSSERLPFSLMLLADVVIVNSFRPKPVNESLSSRMSSLAASSPAIRPFTSDMMTLLIMSRISNQPWLATAFRRQSKLVFLDPMQSQLLAVEPESNLSESGEQSISSIQYDALSPLCSSIREAARADVAVSSLGILKTIIEGVGHTLRGDVWPLIIEAISSLSGDKSYEIDRSGPEWSSCSLSAFKSLKLVVDDFLREILDPPGGASTSLLDCCSSFVTSEQDINTSLTAIGLLWTIADQDSGQNSTDRVLSRLVILASDQRAEVRNAAVNTLFSCIVGRGGGFSSKQWQHVFQNTILMLNETLSMAAGGSDGTHNEKERAKKKAVSTHHSRDSTKKQWDTTNVLVLRGLGRVLRNFFLQLLDSSELAEGDNTVSWFEEAWVHMLDIAYDAACETGGRDTIDIRSAGLETIALCCQLSSKAGIQAASTPARVTTNMEVVNGALRPIRNTPISKSVLDRQHSVAVESTRSNLFLEAFESLESFEEHLQLQVTNMAPKDQDTTIQVLQKLVLGLHKIFDCCKDYEFRSDQMATNCSGVSDPVTIDLESRFIRILTTVLSAAATNPASKFLNQAQRSGIDLLRAMVSNGSSVALARLVEIAGGAFFLPKEFMGNSDLTTYTALNFEASEIVSEQIAKEEISDVVRVSVLHKILSTLSSDEISQREYGRVIPIIEGGLKSASFLSQKNGDVWQKEEDEMWSYVRVALVRMLTPVRIKDALQILDPHGVLTVIEKSIASVPPRLSVEFGSTLISGAEEVLKVAEHMMESSFDNQNAEKIDVYEKLFRTCCIGVCHLNPANEALRKIAEHSLSQMLDASNTEIQHRAYSRIGGAMIDAIIINESMEELTIFVFPQLCKLLSHDDEQVRLKVQKLFETVDLGTYVKSAQERYEEAEKRAAEAEHQLNLLKSKR